MKNSINRLFDLIERYGLSSNNYPTYLEPSFQSAITAKRQGNYVDSLNLLNNIIESESCAYTGLLNSAFKTIAAAGYLYEAKELLKMCDREMQNNQNARAYAQMGIPNNFADHLQRISIAIRGEISIFQYLKSISGNPNYELPKSYETMVREYNK